MANGDGGSICDNVRYGGSLCDGSLLIDYGTRVDLSSMQLSGTLPTELGLLNSSSVRYGWLEAFKADNNTLSGTIPSEMGKLLFANSGDSKLVLSFNRLDGTIPTELASIQLLNSVDLSANRLSGALPSQVASMASLSTFLVASNYLSGPIPAKLANLTLGASEPSNFV